MWTGKFTLCLWFIISQSMEWFFFSLLIYVLCTLYIVYCSLMTSKSAIISIINNNNVLLHLLSLKFTLLWYDRYFVPEKYNFSIEFLFSFLFFHIFGNGWIRCAFSLSYTHIISLKKFEHIANHINTMLMQR